MHGNQVPNTTNTTAPQTTPPRGRGGTTTGGYHNQQHANPNPQLLYYQAMTYGPTLPAGGISYGVWPDTHPLVIIASPFMLNTDHLASGEVSDNARNQITHMLKELGFSPKGCVRAYQKPYPDYFNSISYPQGFRVPNFAKFTGEDSRSTYEHVGQYLAQISVLGANDVYRVQLFPLSLSGTTFNWFTSLAPNSINTWVGLEEKFHEYFITVRLS
jgi:hypothetical protein